MATPRFDLKLSIARVRDVDNLEILVGESFSLEVLAKDGTVLNEVYEVFSNNDGVLSLEVSPDGLLIKAKALTVGASTIQLQHPVTANVVKPFKVTVVAQEAVGATVTSQGARPRGSSE